jgi:hypothetical protein
VTPWLRDILTDHQDTYDTGRLLTVVCVLAAVFYSGWTVLVLAKPFAAQDYGIGVGSLLAGWVSTCRPTATRASRTLTPASSRQK